MQELALASNMGGNGYIMNSTEDTSSLDGGIQQGDSSGKIGGVATKTVSAGAKKKTKIEPETKLNRHMFLLPQPQQDLSFIMSLNATLWRYREVATFEKFEKAFFMRHSNLKRYPVTAAVLRHERQLPLLAYAADILEWQVGGMLMH